MKREQERLDKLVVSVDHDKQSATEQIHVAQSKEKELAALREKLREERERMEGEVARERGRITDQIESERQKLRRQIQEERDAFADRMSADREKMEYVLCTPTTTTTHLSISFDE